MNKRLIFPKHKDYLLETAKNTNNQEENEARTKIPSQEIHLALQKLKAAWSHSYKDKGRVPRAPLKI